MTKTNKTRSALFTSIISLLLCVSMLVGTTFAWFTDTVTSGVNTIAAGNLDVELYHGKDKEPSENDKVTESTLLFTDVGGNVIDQWEPGVVAFTNLKVANVGTLALKYQLSINSTEMNTVKGSNLTLADALKVAVVKGGVSGTREQVVAAASEWKPLKSFTLDGVLEGATTSETYGIVIYWQPGDNTIDNQFNMNNGKTTSDGQPLSITLGVNLFATQEMYEDDSFGDDYDKLATVDTVEELKEALAADYDLIRLGSNISLTAADMTEKVTSMHYTPNYGIMIDADKTVAIDLSGYSLSGNFSTGDSGVQQAILIYVAKGANLTINDSVGTGKVTFNSDIPYDGYSVSAGVAIYNAGNLTVNGGSIENYVPCPTTGPNGETGSIYGIVSPAIDNISSGVLTVNGGKVYSEGHNAVRNFGKIVMNGGKMSSAAFVAVDNEANSSVEIHGGTMDGGKATSMIVNGIGIVDGGVFLEKINPKSGSTLTVTGGTFGADPSSYIAEGYSAVKNADGMYTVFKGVTVADADSLKTALNNAKEGDTIVLSSNLVLNEKVTIDAGKEVTLNLNGHTLSGAFSNQGVSAVIENKGSLTIENGTVVSLAEYPDVDWGEEGYPTYATNTISNRGNLVIGAGAVVENQTNAGGASYAVDNYSGATLTVEEGAVIKAKDVAIRMFSGDANKENKVVIKGGTITGKRAVWVHLPSSNSAVAPKTTLEINGGALNSTSDLTIYSYSYGNSFAQTIVNITGGTFSNDVAFGGGYKGDQETVVVTGGIFNGELGRYLANDGWEEIVKP